MSEILKRIINAIETCSKDTGVDLAAHPFATNLYGVKTPGEVLQLYQAKAKEIETYVERDQILVDRLLPIVCVLYSLSGLLGNAVSLDPFLAARAILVIIDVLLSVARRESSGYNALVELFGSLEVILRRVPSFTKISIMVSVSDVVVNILLEVLFLFSVATRQMKQGRFKNKLLSSTDTGNIETVLQRLDRLTGEDVSVAVVETLDVIHGLVSNVKMVVDGGEVSMSAMRPSLVRLHRAASIINRRERANLADSSINWLSPPEPSENHIVMRRHFCDGSTMWFTQGSQFKKWDATGCLLWIHGKSGSGKSMLSSAILEEAITLNEAGLCLASFFYFDSTDPEKQCLREFLVSTVIRLFVQSYPYFQVFQKLYVSHGYGSKLPDNKALTQCLKDMLMLPRHPTVYLIMDALNECPIDSRDGCPRNQVLDLIEDLVGLHLPNLRIWVTSRLEPDIELVLKPLASFTVCLHDEDGQKQSIVDFIKFVVQSDRDMKNWSVDIKKLVVDTLSQSADGRFRWVATKLGALPRQLDIPRYLEECKCKARKPHPDFTA